MRKFFIVLVWGMGLGLAALFTKDIVRGVRNSYFNFYVQMRTPG